MRISSLTFALLVTLGLSCSEITPRQQHQVQKQGNLNNRASKPPSFYKDTLRIEAPAAVFYYPDSVQLEKLASMTEEKVFEQRNHEFEYLIKTAHKVIQRDQPAIQITEAKDKRYLIFSRKGKSDVVDLDRNYDPYGLYIFDGRQAPVLVDMANTETELGFYFAKQQRPHASPKELQKGTY